MGKEDLEVLAARIAEGEKREREEKIKEFREKMKKERKGFFTEFKKFITRGNVMDMAVGVIIGAAFGSIGTALTLGRLVGIHMANAAPSADAS